MRKFYSSRFRACGNVQKVEVVEYSNGTKELLKITLKAGEDYITYAVMNTKNDPQKTQNLLLKLREGDFVQTDGNVSTNEYEDRTGNLRVSENFVAFGTNHVEEISDPQIFLTVAGIVKSKMDSDNEDDKKIRISVYDDYSTKTYEYLFRLDKSMADFFDDIDVGDNVSVVAKYVNRTVADINASTTPTYGQQIDGVTPAGMARKRVNEKVILQGFVVAQADDLTDEDDFEAINNDDIPF